MPQMQQTPRSTRDIADLARRAYVSIPTVARYFAGMRVRPAMKERIEKALAEVLAEETAAIESLTAVGAKLDRLLKKADKPRPSSPPPAPRPTTRRRKAA